MGEEFDSTSTTLIDEAVYEEERKWTKRKEEQSSSTPLTVELRATNTKRRTTKPSLA